MSTASTGSALRPQELAERALEISIADGCVVIAEETSEANLRWAGNTLTTNGVTRGRTLTVIATIGGQEGTAAGVVSRSNVGLDEVESIVRAAEAKAQESRSAEDARPLPEAEGADATWDDPPTETSIGVFGDVAPALGEAFTAARGDQRDLFGFAEHYVETAYLATSTGLRRRHAQPSGRIELTGKSADWSRSTWVGQGTRDFTDVDVSALDAEVRRRLGWAQRRVDLPAGRYETLLPPSAVADLLIYQYWSSVARDANDGKTVFSRAGGGTRVGERLTETPVRMWSDPAAEGLECEPFVVAGSSNAAQSVFDNGLPINSTDWLNDGSLTALMQTRHSAELTGLPFTPGVDNLLFESARRDPGSGGDDRRHRARLAADLPLVHPRGGAPDPPADRAHPRRRLPGRRRRGRRGGQQLPVQREPRCPARPPRRGGPDRADAGPRVERLLHPYGNAGLADRRLQHVLGEPSLLSRWRGPTPLFR